MWHFEHHSAASGKNYKSTVDELWASMNKSSLKCSLLINAATIRYRIKILLIIKQNYNQAQL